MANIAMLNSDDEVTAKVATLPATPGYYAFYHIVPSSQAVWAYTLSSQHFFATRDGSPQANQSVLLAGTMGTTKACCNKSIYRIRPTWRDCYQ